MAMLDMKPYGFVKASETLARRHRLTRPGPLVWGEVSKVCPAGSREWGEGGDGAEGFGLRIIGSRGKGLRIGN